MTAYACARCGEKPRDADTFLCADCLDDPERMAEVRRAQMAQPDNGKLQRQLLIDMAGWAGWSRRLKGANRA